MKLKFNSYNVLWLETNASHKEINKRYKEIEKYLNIGEVPSYEGDLSFLDYKQIRTSSSIKSAFEVLSNNKHKFCDFFLWFQINDSTDEQAMASLKQWNHKEAIQIWKEQYESNNTTRRFLYAKNLLILLLIKWIEGDKFIIKNIEETVHIWKEMIDATTFWKLFESIFDEANDETDDFKITKAQKDEIIKSLSTIYMNIGESISDLSIFWKFSQIFNLATSSVDHSMMDDIYQSIEWAVKDLEGLDISSDWIFDDKEKKVVKDSINLIQEALNKTIDLSFYEDSRILLYRDRASKAIRKIVLDLHNNLDETKKSLALLRIAQQISWTENLKEQIQIDINQIEKNITQEANSVIAIPIPWSFWHNQELIFKNNSLEYNWKILKFNEIDGVSFYSVKNSVNWITTWTNYDIKFYAGSSDVRLKFSSGMFNSWNEEKWGIFWKIFGISKWIIEPLII